MSAFKEINPKEIVESPFKLIGDDWALVTAGDREKFNTMTISWGALCGVSPLYSPLFVRRDIHLRLWRTATAIQ